MLILCTIINIIAIIHYVSKQNKFRLQANNAEDQEEKLAFMKAADKQIFGIIIFSIALLVCITCFVMIATAPSY